MYGRPPQNGPIYDGGNARRVDGTLYALRLVIAYGDRLFDTDVNAPRGAGFDDRGFLDVLGQDIRDVGLFPIEHFRVAFVIILAIIPNDVFFVPARGIAKGRKLGGAAEHRVGLLGKIQRHLVYVHMGKADDRSSNHGHISFQSKSNKTFSCSHCFHCTLFPV